MRGGGVSVRVGIVARGSAGGLGFVRGSGVPRGQRLRGESMGSVRRSRLSGGVGGSGRGQVCASIGAQRELSALEGLVAGQGEQRDLPSNSVKGTAVLPDTQTRELLVPLLPFPHLPGPASSEPCRCYFLGAFFLWPPFSRVSFKFQPHWSPGQFLQPLLPASFLFPSSQS